MPATGELAVQHPNAVLAIVPEADVRAHPKFG